MYFRWLHGSGPSGSNGFEVAACSWNVLPGACEDGEVRFDPPHGRRHAPCHQGASTPRVRRAHGSILPSRPTRRRLGDERRRGRDAIKRGGYVVTNCGHVVGIRSLNEKTRQTVLGS